MRTLRALLYAGLLGMAGHAQATEVDISGFGSFVGGIKSKEGSVFLYETEKLDFKPDSLAGIQVRGNINDKAAATLQLIARGIENWEPSVDWAYASYEVRSDITWRMGRLRLPLYLYSDFLTIGYTYPWISPPYAVYYFPLSTVDGTDIVYTFTAGEVDIELQAYIGTSSFEFKYGPLKDMVMDIHSHFGLVSEASYEEWKIRLAYHRANLNLDTSGSPTGQALEALANAVEAQGYASMANDLRFDGDLFEFADFAVQYDDTHYLAVFESNYVTTHDNAPNPDGFNYFLTAGIREGELLYHINYSREKDIGPKIGNDLPVDSPFYRIGDSVRSTFARGRTCWTMGLRWDFTEKMVFKTEVSYFADMGPTKESAELDNTVLTRFGIQTIF